MDTYLKFCRNTFENTLQMVPLVNGAIIGTNDHGAELNIESFLKHLSIAYHSLNNISSVLHMQECQNPQNSS